MLTSSASLSLGLTFVLVGAINVWLILQASARVKEAKASARLIAAHRVGGYLFIALFCVMAFFMVARLGDVGASASPGTMIHLTLAMVGASHQTGWTGLVAKLLQPRGEADAR